MNPCKYILSVETWLYIRLDKILGLVKLSEAWAGRLYYFESFHAPIISSSKKKKTDPLI